MKVTHIESGIVICGETADDMLDQQRCVEAAWERGIDTETIKRALTSECPLIEQGGDEAACPGCPWI